MLQRWLFVVNTVSDMNNLRFKPQTSRFRDERVIARPTGRSLLNFFAGNLFSRWNFLGCTDNFPDYVVPGSHWDIGRPKRRRYSRGGLESFWAGLIFQVERPGCSGPDQSAPSTSQQHHSSYHSRCARQRHYHWYGKPCWPPSTELDGGQLCFQLLVLSSNSQELLRWSIPRKL